jgi:Na+(H+)/acetate symporter ActP
LLVAVMIAAALGSKAGELNALGTTSTIDLWRHFRPLAAHDERRNVRVAKWLTAAWGLVAIAFALYAGFKENLIETINIIGSIFYGVVLGIFLVAFFLKWVGGTAVFWAAVTAQTVILALYLLRKAVPSLEFSYLWYNLIGCALCVGLSLVLQFFLRGHKRTPPDPI